VAPLAAPRPGEVTKQTGRWVQLALGIVISAGCIALAVRGLDLAHVAEALSSAAYGWLLPAIALYFAGVWVRAVRWRLLLAPVRPDRPVSAARLFPVVVIGYMANDVLPFRLGEIARCYVLRRREGIAQTAALGTVLVERIMDGITMLAFMGVALAFLPATADLELLLRRAGALFGVTVLVLVAITLRPDLATRLVDVLVGPLPESVGRRARGIATSVLSGLASLSGARGALRVFALSCLAWGLEAGMYYVLMAAFPIQQSLPLAVLTTAVANLGSLVPSSPGYVGVFEYFALLAMVPFGVPEELAFAYILVVHAALVVPVTLLGFFYAAREGLALNRIASAPEATAEV
jgi:glycosyltransferase 2 family protein